MLKRLSIAAAALVAATPAFAHLNPAEHGSLLAGVSHPLTGADHLLVMVAVGLWASTIGGAARWVVPSAFVATMSGGFALALAGMSLPFVEPTILASIVALGLLVALAVRLPAAPAAAVVALFALFHGYAHGSELGEAGALDFGIGFALTTAGLHGIGLLVGDAVARSGRPLLVRMLGAASAVAGLVLMAG
ncbi:HupE/UreJ family protein [Mangrovibrevibacter kandeliae]|uniref:HupE/UreJ family protein n=1 Tax=Mangrovibrevibacter kandeliae TaxID=2968473 RepID=UPI00211980A9|nr:HupE/UreJ family protein [Aurantimonas sp. CSK15Z-1]MCQ8783185.1 HupE/UreJ family protein [Aurantimonas sp. CSK15Z-1]